MIFYTLIIFYKRFKEMFINLVKYIWAIVLGLFLFEVFFACLYAILPYLEAQYIIGKYWIVYPSLFPIQSLMNILNMKSIIITDDNNNCILTESSKDLCSIDTYYCFSNNINKYTKTIYIDRLTTNRYSTPYFSLYDKENWNGCHCRYSEFFAMDCVFRLYSCAYLDGYKLKLDTIIDKNSSVVYTYYNGKNRDDMITMTQSIKNKMKC